jgi:hypothetical protein
VAKASGEPDEGYAWISKVETTEDPEELQESEGTELLDSKVAAGFAKIMHGDSAKQIQLLEEKAEAGNSCSKAGKSHGISRTTSGSTLIKEQF